MALNAATSTGDRMAYSGPIQRKWILQGRGKSYQIDVLDSSTAHMVTFIIPPQKYNSLSEGDIFTAEFIRGGFGIPYRWRIGSQSERNKLPD
jgi:hypothetical protein